MKNNGFGLIGLFLTLVLIAVLSLYAYQIYFGDNAPVSIKFNTEKGALKEAEELKTRLLVPNIVRHLCTVEGEKQYLRETDGHQIIFKGKASTAQKCNGGKIWKFIEDLTDPAIFYFDNQDHFLNVCDTQEKNTDCDHLNKISCEDTNYCDFFP